MSGSANSETRTQDQETFAIVTVPEHLRQQVLDYVKSLESDDDVSGFMLNLAGRSASSLTTRQSETNCWFFDTKLPVGGVDFQCSD